MVVKIPTFEDIYAMLSTRASLRMWSTPKDQSPNFVKEIITFVEKTSIFEDLYAFLSTRASLLWPTPSVDPEKDQSSINFFKEIFLNFVESLEYCPPEAMLEPRTYQSLCSDFAAYNTGGGWFEPLCLQSSTVAELSYPGHPPEVQLQIARFTWYLIYIDDLGRKFPSLLEGFQQRVFTNESPGGAVLQAFRQNLTDMYQFWDAIPANFIAIAAMDFLNGCLLEEMPTIRNMKLSDSSDSWPYYLRNKTGVSAAYAYMIFPRASNLDVSVYIQAIEDIIFFTNITNDILSFYKEFLAGETNTYVYNRAHVTGKSIPDTLQDMVNDTLAAHARITKTLESTDANIPWRHYVNGYLAFHLTLQRYRLSELGF